MNDFFNHDDSQDALGTLMAAARAVLAAVVILLLLNVGEPKQSESEANTITERGNVRVEAIWPSEIDADIDLWCKSPGDPIPVGFSNKSGPVFNLLRDDLGFHTDRSGLNYELMYARGLPSGEWACNLYWFSNPGGVKTVPIKINITISQNDDPKASSKDPPKKLIETDLVLTYVTEEVTVLRWKVDSQGGIVDGSLTNLLRRMYSFADTNP